MSGLASCMPGSAFGPAFWSNQGSVSLLILYKCNLTFPSGFIAHGKSVNLPVCTVCSRETPEGKKIEGCSGPLQRVFLGPSSPPEPGSPFFLIFCPSPTAICLKEVALQLFTGSHRPPLPQLPPATADPGPLLVYTLFEAGSRDALFPASPSAAQIRSVCLVCSYHFLSVPVT